MIAASMTAERISAPLKPSLIAEIFLKSTSFESGIFFVCTAKIDSLEDESGIGISIILSNRPGRSSAGSSNSGLLVAAII